MLRRMETMTWVELREAANQTHTAIIPIGAIEMQGPHLPLVVDSMTAQYVAEKVAEKANAVLAPLITIGTSEWHKNFPGMIGLDNKTLLDYLKQYCGCLAKSGFTHLFFISPHTYNDGPICTVAFEMRDQGVLVGSINLWHATNELIQSRNIDIKEGKFTHAGEIMTSVVMAIAPETVKMDKATVEYSTLPIPGSPVTGLHKIRFQDMSFFIYRCSNEETTSGSLGDPRAATAEKGRQIVEGWVDAIVPFLGRFSECNQIDHGINDKFMI